MNQMTLLRHMPAHSLNWSRRSSAILYLSMSVRPPEVRRNSASNLSLIFDTTLGTNARRPTFNKEINKKYQEYLEYFSGSSLKDLKKKNTCNIMVKEIIQFANVSEWKYVRMVKTSFYIFPPLGFEPYFVFSIQINIHFRIGIFCKST